MQFLRGLRSSAAALSAEPALAPATVSEPTTPPSTTWVPKVLQRLQTLYRSSSRLKLVRLFLRALSAVLTPGFAVVRRAIEELFRAGKELFYAGKDLFRGLVAALVALARQLYGGGGWLWK